MTGKLPDAEIMVALCTRVPVAVRIALGTGRFVWKAFCNLCGCEAVNDARVELVHLLALDNLVALASKRFAC